MTLTGRIGAVGHAGLWFFPDTGGGAALWVPAEAFGAVWEIMSSYSDEFPRDGPCAERLHSVAVVTICATWRCEEDLGSLAALAGDVDPRATVLLLAAI